MKGKRKERGITLIALVITIIILLILAGVSIAMLTGNNGVLSQAEKAKNETENAQTFEGQRLDEYNSTLSNWVSGEKTDEKDETEETPIFDENTLTIGDATNVDKYGQEVTKYTVKAGDMTTNVWRLFYQDSNYTYLITDEYVGMYEPYNSYINNYTSGADVSTIGKKLNSMLLENKNFFTGGNKNPNILSVAWLTDTDEWAEFKNEDAVFAIGSPTIELFTKSFNSTATANGAKEITLSVGKTGYVNNTISNQIKTSYNKGIYNKENLSNWWISSPYDSGSYSQFVVYGYYECFDKYNVDSASYPIRPIVCIPTSVFNSEYLSSLVGE